MTGRWSREDDARLERLEREMAGPLSEAREAARVFAGRAWQRDAVTPGTVTARLAMRQAGTPSAGWGRRWAGWAAGCVAAAALAVGGVRLSHAPHGTLPGGVPAARESALRVESVRPGEASGVSDDALLQQIDRDLSTGVPVAMEPLEASNARRGGTRQAE